MKNRIQTKSLILISVASLIYTVWIYSGAMLHAISGGIEGPNAFYPWFVALEGIVLFAAAAIPFASVFRPSILNRRAVRWTAALCLAYGILISINFFVRMPVSFSAWYVQVGLRFVSWCALAYLTFWPRRRRGEGTNAHPSEATTLI